MSQDHGSRQEQRRNPFADKEGLQRRIAEARRQRAELEARYPTILDRLEYAIEHAPKITKRRLPTPQEMAEETGLSVTELSETIGQEASGFEQRLRKRESSNPLEEDFFPLMERVYALYEASAGSRFSEGHYALRPFRSREALFAAYCPGSTPYSNARFTRCLEQFQALCVHPRRVVKTFPRFLDEQGNCSICEAEGDWILMPCADPWDARVHTYAERDVILCVAGMIRDGHLSPDLAHVTGSAALTNIGELGGLLSAQEQFKRGHRPKTGEYTSQVSESGSRFDMMGANSPFGYGHDAVYLSHKECAGGYQTIHWFDEFPVLFGISSEKQNAYLRTAADVDEDARMIHDYESEGSRGGPRVPFTSIETLAVPIRHLGEARLWTERHCPHVRVYAMEALDLITEKAEIMERVAEEEGIPLAHAWLKPLEKSGARK